MAAERFVRGMAVAMGCSPGLVDEAGVTVSPSAGRAENHVTAGYVLGHHLIITCDPAVTDKLIEATRGIDPTLDAWQRCAQQLGAEPLGAGRMQTLAADRAPAIPAPAGHRLQRLDAALPGDRELIEQLVATSSADDLYEAELELDNLDPVIDVVLDADTKIASYAGARPWDMVDGYCDIGVMTRADCRNQDLGKAAVAALCHHLDELGDEPLYRCDEDNIGSVKLSAALGFEVATNLVAYRFAV